MFALVDILGAVQPFVSGGAGAGEGSIDGAGVANRALVTRIRRASVVEMAQQSYETDANSSPFSHIYLPITKNYISPIQRYTIPA